MNCQAPSVYSPARSAHPSDAVRNTTTSSGTTVSVTKLIVNIELSFSPRCALRRWHNPSSSRTRQHNPHNRPRDRDTDPAVRWDVRAHPRGTASPNRLVPSVDGSLTWTGGRHHARVLATR